MPDPFATRYRRLLASRGGAVPVVDHQLPVGSAINDQSRHPYYEVAVPGDLTLEFNGIGTGRPRGGKAERTGINAEELRGAHPLDCTMPPPRDISDSAA